MNIGTHIYTWMNGDLVGTDEFGNRYYKSKGRKLQGRERRWCLFKGQVEASKVPAEWHAWLHHTVEEPLTDVSPSAPDWRQEHQPNLTGTAGAYRPRGHDYVGGQRAAATGDYEAWKPE